MEISQAVIRGLLDGRLHQWNQARSQPYEIAWQGVTFSAKTETFLQPFLLPAGVFSQDLEGVHRMYTAIYQVSITTPAKNGASIADVIAYEIAELFPLNLVLGASLKLQVTTPVSPGPALVQSSAFTMPVSFQVRADLI